MRFKTWAWGLSVAAATLLTACGGGGDSSTAQMRLLNASIGYAALDMSVDSTTVNSAVAYAGVGSYADVKTSATGTEIQSNSVGSTLASSTPTLAAGSHYAMIAYGSAGSLQTTLLQEDQEAPASGKSKLLVLNLAPDAGSMDVYVTGADETLDTASTVAAGIAAGSGSGYVSLNSGTFRVRLTAAGSKSDVRLDIPSITLPSAGVSTLVLTGSAGGVLVNGIQLIQQGATTNFPNTTARARLVAAVGGSALVSGSVGQTALMPTSVAPTIGDYTTLTAGAADLSVYVNGQLMSFAKPTLVAGNDYTLMVWGPAASPQLAVLTDDNRLPTSPTTTAKIRLVNGVASAATGLTLNVDYSALASNVVAGTASTAQTTPASTSALLTVTSPSSTTPVYSLSDLGIAAGYVYTVFVMGDNTAMVGSLRRERTNN
ncbi:hypothetical protein FHT39_004497 [Mitsuaria sp. BK045]|uniref:DUF4397 domain-containing protein n=1 Tax=unclassified Roseateles TaxID=2626991 RepID=UPI0016148436|nr:MULTISPECIES: DUF4397 domain-containing protein [unclassified Roseateles]MBB3295817.1 hypothetical protein [Mitsuaria sp. BK041]MBB3365033.1 hypothetical protein [Mitsuaria sp. BK045]